jgi:hypothetical protein
MERIADFRAGGDEQVVKSDLLSRCAYPKKTPPPWTG